jgi:hypothetical protein
MLRWYESNGSTLLAAIALGTLKPGQEYAVVHGAPRDYVLKNEGEASLTVLLAIMPVATYPANQYLLVGVGNTEPAPEAFVDSTDPPLALGTIAAGGQVRVWVNAVLPNDAEYQQAMLARLRAYEASA